MKATELMKGNWVISSRWGCPVQIVTVGSRVTYYYGGTLRQAELKDIGPILLSDEILKKVSSCVVHHPGTGATEEVIYYNIERLEIKHNTEDWRHEYFAVVGLPCYELKWLHQLQNLMRGCGIEKEITL